VKNQIAFGYSVFKEHFCTPNPQAPRYLLERLSAQISGNIMLQTGKYCQEKNEVYHDRSIRPTFQTRSEATAGHKKQTPPAEKSHQGCIAEEYFRDPAVRNFLF